MEGSHGRHGSIDKRGLQDRQLLHVPAAMGCAGHPDNRLPDLPAAAGGAENQKSKIEQGEQPHRFRNLPFSHKGEQICEYTRHHHHLHYHITGNSEIIGACYLVHRADDAAQH